MVKKFVVFYIPDGNLSLKINSLKKLFNKRYKNLDYVNHFPHLTFFTFESSKNFYDEKLLFKLNNHFKKYVNKKIKIDVNKTNIFIKDIMTNKDTIYFEIKKNRNLLQLQGALLKIFKNYIKVNDKIKFSQDILNKNYFQFGYPFIGEIWLPHMTICSIKDSKNKLLVKKFLETKINFSSIINNLSLWQIVNKNKHKKIMEISI